MTNFSKPCLQKTASEKHHAVWTTSKASWLEAHRSNLGMEQLTLQFKTEEASAYVPSLSLVFSFSTCASKQKKNFRKSTEMLHWTYTLKSFRPYWLSDSLHSVWTGPRTWLRNMMSQRWLQVTIPFSSGYCPNRAISLTRYYIRGTRTIHLEASSSKNGWLTSWVCLSTTIWLESWELTLFSIIQKW